MKKQSQFKKSQKMDVNIYSTKEYERNDIFAVPENKANSNPIFKSEDRRQKAEYCPSGYGEGLRQDESGLAMTRIEHRSSRIENRILVL
ncbi:MAG: hypothetical protein ACYST5_03920 [Planctomycetota bacterium]|jgi:hypothetical protein